MTPAMFCVSWCTTMLGRKLSLSDTLIVWDCLLSDSMPLAATVQASVALLMCVACWLNPTRPTCGGHVMAIHTTPFLAAHCTLYIQCCSVCCAWLP